MGARSFVRQATGVADGRARAEGLDARQSAGIVLHRFYPEAD